MGRLLSFEDKKRELDPHVQGKARCMACTFEWQAIAPVGVLWLECPNCHTQRGLFVFPHERSGMHQTCECGNWLWAITPEGRYCPNCGLYAEFFRSGRET